MAFLFMNWQLMINTWVYLTACINYNTWLQSTADWLNEQNKKSQRLEYYFDKMN